MRAFGASHAKRNGAAGPLPVARRDYCEPESLSRRVVAFELPVPEECDVPLVLPVPVLAASRFTFEFALNVTPAFPLELLIPEFVVPIPVLLPFCDVPDGAPLNVATS